MVHGANPLLIMESNLFIALGLVACLGLSFWLSGMEAGVLALSRLRIRQQMRAGRPSAKVLHQFLENPDNYKVCKQCNSIVFVRSRVCQLCGCYRFDYTRAGVECISRIIGNSPFPFTAGVVPRY